MSENASAAPAGALRILLAFTLAASLPCAAQTAASRPALGRVYKRTYVSPTDGAAVDYALWVPDAYDARRPWPLIVFLHGSAEGRDWAAPTTPAASIPVRGERNDLQFLVAFPLMRGSVTITGLAERDVLETIADVRASYSIDADRIHLTGISFGGFAAWQIACHYPDLFASVTPFCGGGRPELAVNLRHVSTRVYHGSADRAVPPLHSREMVDAMRKARLKPEYHEIPGAGHVCWRQAYADPDFYRSLEGVRRPAAPDRVVYRTHNLRSPGAYWASIRQMIDPATPALVDAFAPPEGPVHVHVENVARLVLNPPRGGGHGFLVDGRPVSAVREQDGWRLDLAPVSAPPVKQSCLFGPIQDIYNEPFVVVLPTGDAAFATGWVRAAEAALGWTSSLVYRNVRKVRDTGVTPDLAASNSLLCFGDAAANRFLAPIADKLPLVWSDGRLAAGDRSLANVAAVVMICPNPIAPSRYLVVCSGLPQAVEALASEVLRPAMLAPAPAEDVVVLMASGQLLYLDAAATRAARPSRMNEPPIPRGVLFDNRWRLTPQALDRFGP